MSYNDGLCYHYLGISLFIIAKIIAIVYPYSFISSDLWLVISGIIPKHALSNIDISLSFQLYGIGNYLYSKKPFNDLPIAFLIL